MRENGSKGDSIAVRRRGVGLESLRLRIRQSDFVSRSPFVLAMLRKIWSAADAMRIRKSRSYIHGLLFDLKGDLYRTEGMAFRIAKDQFPRSYRSRLYFDVYEAPERMLAHKWIRSDASVLELGGCVGVVSCVVNKLLRSPKSHVVVEANPTLISYLRENRDANGCSFQIENCVVSQASEVEFYISNIMTANRTDSGVGSRVNVEAKTLEALERRHGVNFDTLIIDIEGGEFDFFIENADRLAEIDLVLLELHRQILTPLEVESCTSILEQAGLVQVDMEGETEVWARTANRTGSI